MKLHYFAFVSASLLLGSAVMNQSVAATVQLNYATKLRGPDLIGPPPWVTATFEDSSVPGTVIATISTAGLSGTERIRRMFFNFSGGFDPRLLKFSYLPTSTAAPINRIRAAPDRFRAAESGWYDIVFRSYGTRQLSGGETLQYAITGAPGLTANAFAASSAVNCQWGFCNGVSPYRAAAVLSKNGNAPWPPISRSWIAALDETSPTAVPVPGAAWLFGSGLMGLAGIARRRRAG